MLTFESWLALRYLFSRKGDGFLSVIAAFSLIGIALGVATLIIVMSVFNGFREDLMNRILGVSSHITVVSATGPIEDYPTLIERLEHEQQILTAQPIIDGQVLAAFQGQTTGAFVRGMREIDFATDPLLSRSLKAGNIGDFPTGVMVGSGLAHQLGVGVGDPLTIISPRGTATAFGTVPRSQAFPIVGIYEVGLYQFDASLVFMPLQTAQKFFRTGSTVSALDLKVEDPFNIKSIRPLIYDIAGENVQMIDWQDRYSSFFNALQVQRNVMFVILTLIILVAAFNIISMLVLLVKNKRGSIAILRAVGATRGQILRIFLLNGSALGLMGIIAGVILGIVFVENIDSIRLWLEGILGTELFSADIYALPNLPARLAWEQVLAVVAMTFVLSLLAALYPAWRAAKQDPVEVLRHE